MKKYPSRTTIWSLFFFTFLCFEVNANTDHQISLRSAAFQVLTDNAPKTIASKTTPDGTKVVFISARETDGVNELFVTPICGGSMTKLNDNFADDNRDVFTFTISPDSKRVVYRADQDTDGVTELYSVSINGGVATKLNPDISITGGNVGAVVLISPNSNRVIYQADTDIDGVDELFSVPIAGGMATKLNPDLPGNNRRVSFFRISPNSERVIYLADQDINDASELFSVPIIGGTPIKLNPDFTNSNQDIIPNGGSVQISQNSSRVIYLADQDIDGVQELFSVPIEGGGLAVKLHPDLPVNRDVSAGRIKLTSDGSHVVYVSDQDINGVTELFSVSIAGGLTTKLNPDFSGDKDIVSGIFEISPEGSNVVYLADQETDGITELFSVAVGGGPSTKLNAELPNNGDVTSSIPKISPDGSRVLYLADQETDGVTELFSVQIDGGISIKINAELPINGDVSSSGFGFSPEGTRVIYIADQELDGVNDLFSSPINGSANTKLNIELGSDEDISGSIDFTPDGKAVVYRAVTPNGVFNPSLSNVFSVPITGGVSIKLNASPHVCVDELILSQDSINPGLFLARLRIQAQGAISNGSNVHFKASESITLQPGFEISAGGLFSATIAEVDCLE